MRRLLALLLVLGLCLPLPAVGRDVLLIDDDKAGALELEGLIGACFPSDFRTDSGTLAFYAAKRERLERNKAGAALDAAYKSGDPEKVAQARQALEPYFSSSLSSSSSSGAAPQAGKGGGDEGGSPGEVDGRTCLRTVAPGEEEAAFLRRAFATGDERAVSDYVLANGADMAILLASETSRSLVRSRIFVYERGEVAKVYERIESEKEKSSDEAQALFALVPYFFPPDSSLVVFDRTAPDFETLRPRGPYLVARPGTYSYNDENIGGRGYLQVPPSQIVHLSYFHQKRVPSPLLATGFSNGIEIRANGALLGRTPVMLDGLMSPFSLTASMEGRKSLSFQSDKPLKELDIRLLPASLGRNELYEKARDGFYWAFARTIALFGGRVLASSLAGEGEAWKVAGLALEGAVWISVVDLIRDLFDYYRAGINISEQGGL